MKSRNNSNISGTGGRTNVTNELQIMSGARGKQSNEQLSSSSSSLLATNSSTGQNVSRMNQSVLNNQQANSQQAIRKRRSSINVYDQPSSLNSRLRQLETDMLRLDEDRTKLYDDTHSSLAQCELKLNELQAILKSRQDNVDKYIDDMKVLLQAKEEFEKHTKLLNEKHERIQEKFMHREITISREIKLLKNKFDLLEKNRQFRSILQKSNSSNSNNNFDSASEFDPNNDQISNFDSTRTRSEATSEGTISTEPKRLDGIGGDRPKRKSGRKSVRIKSLGSKFGPWKKFFNSLINPFKGVFKTNNKVSSINHERVTRKEEKEDLQIVNNEEIKDQTQSEARKADVPPPSTPIGNDISKITNSTEVAVGGEKAVN